MVLCHSRVAVLVFCSGILVRRCQLQNTSGIWLWRCNHICRAPFILMYVDTHYTLSNHYELMDHQWQQSCHIDNLFFPVCMKCCHSNPHVSVFTRYLFHVHVGLTSKIELQFMLMVVLVLNCHMNYFVLVLTVIMYSFYYFLDRILFHHGFHHDSFDYYWDCYGHSFHFELCY